jgi:hypothetical protein
MGLQPSEHLLIISWWEIRDLTSGGQWNEKKEFSKEKMLHGI